MSESTRPEFLFLGNQLWLDFLNTHIQQSGEWVDKLGDFTDFVRWLQEAGVLNDAEAKEARQRWPETSKRAQILEQARAFRAVLRTALETVMRSEELPGGVITTINDILRHHCRSLEIVSDSGKLMRRYVGELSEPVHLLAPVAESAAVALTDDDLVLTRKCENPVCVLHFHDTSKNHTRRWCSMKTCGNRLKAAAHYRRACH